jgi:hypothetical protein
MRHKNELFSIHFHQYEFSWTFIVFWSVNILRRVKSFVILLLFSQTEHLYPAYITLPEKKMYLISKVKNSVTCKGI